MPRPKESLSAVPEIEAPLPGLGAHARAESGDLLQRTLVELIALSLIGKQLQWNITGDEFRSLHLHLDELDFPIQPLND